MSVNERFSDSFWSPSASMDSIPNYTLGLNVLHDRLLKSIGENEAITKYLQKRIDTELRCADILTTNLTQKEQDISNSEWTSMNAGLKSAFDMVCHESTEAAHCHRVRAGVLAQDVLEPLSNFTRLFETELMTKKAELEDQVAEFEHTAQSALLTRSVYWSRCRALELACPDFRPPVPSGFEEEEEQEQYKDDEDFIDNHDDFVNGAIQRSSSVTSELNVDRGGVRLGKCTVLPYREVARSMGRMQKMIEGTKPSAIAPRKFLGKHVFEWIRDYVVSPPTIQHDEKEITLDTESQEICQHLVALKFLRSVPKETTGFFADKYYEVQQNVVERYLRKTRIRRSVDDGQPDTMSQQQETGGGGGEVHNMTLEVPSSTSSGPVSVLNEFFGRFKPGKKQAVDPSTKALVEMNEADNAYKKKIKSVDKMRKSLEESMVGHFDDMERLEKDRINTIKHAFITMAIALSNTLPMFKETYNRITLFQETLKAEQDIHSIVEQYKTGPFCPKPMIYENYYHGSATDQIFGVPLEEVAQIYGSYVPPIVLKGIKLIDAGLAVKNNSKDKDKACEEIWSNIIPVKEMNEICEKLDGLAGSKLKTVLETYDLNVLANLIRVYLLELPECILTYDLYDPVKILYATQQDTESRLMSVSKLLATLPSANYHTLKALSHHLYKLLKQTTRDDMLSKLISMFAYILMRPRTSSSINMHDRHPKKLVRDLLTQYNIIFTKEINKAQKSGATRSAIIADNTSSFFVVSPPPEETMPALQNIESAPPSSTPNEEQNTESALRRTLLNIMHRNSAEIGTRVSSLEKHNNEESDSPGGPLIVPHSRITLFDDPDRSEPTPKQSGTSSPQNQVVSNRHSLIIDEDDKVDAERLSTDVSLMLDMDDESDAVEIADKEEVDRRRLTPTTERTPNRSRASTRGTMDNVVLDSFFDD